MAHDISTSERQDPPGYRARDPSPLSFGSGSEPGKANGKDLYEIGRKDGMPAKCSGKRFGVTPGRKISGEPVQMDGAHDSLECPLRVLCHHPGYDAGENVAGSTGGHRRIAGGIDPRLSVRTGNDGTVAFEDEDQLVLGSKAARQVNPVALDLRDTHSRKSRHFARMRGEHECFSGVLSATLAFCRIKIFGSSLERIEAIGIEHNRGVEFSHEFSHHRGGLFVPG